MLSWLYFSVYHMFGGDEFNTYVFGGTIITAFSYWLFNSFFISLDLIKPRWAEPYKIQEKTATLADYTRTLKGILINQIFVAPATTAVWFFVAKARGCQFAGPLPSYWEFSWNFAVCMVVLEISFYYTHIMFHTPLFYKLHKQHHEWTSPISLVSIYCHPLEHAVSNVSSLLLGPIVCGSHCSFLWFWAVFAIFSTTCTHSGFHFPFMLPAEHHDYHHQHGDENFGLGLGMDHINGTDRRFRASVGARRSFISWSLTPVQEQVPQ